MKRTIILPTVLLALTAAPALAAPEGDLTQRGEYLTRAADCAACHTIPGGKPFTGGRAFKLPVGTIYAPNITPDKETGIGEYSDDEFVRALQEGVGRGGKHLFPAFPYTSYTGMSRDDILAIKAYLFSLPPEHAPAPQNQLRFPFDQRWALAGWNLLFNANKRFTPDPAQSADWNRGAYLVEAVAHCGECHTPRNLAQAREESSRKFAGNTINGWKAYNITPDPVHGIGQWSEADIESYLATGHADGHGSAGGPMGEAVNYSLRYLTKSDIHAIAVYLKSVPAIAGGVSAPAETTSASPAPTSGAATQELSAHDDVLGARIFAGACASCHLWNGQGRQSPYAALTGSRTTRDPEGTNLMQTVLKGAPADGPGSTASFMPAFGQGYTDAEIAAVSNYVIAHFGGKTGTVTPDAVQKARSVVGGP
jgi:mono/diheme cytochrome c family protein